MSHVDELDRTATPPAANREAALGRVLVTGGASGLGAAIVAAVTAGGGTPLVLDRDAPAAAVEHEQVDLADARAAEAAVTRGIDRLGGLDAIVTAAGTDACGPIDAIPGADWDRVIAVNLIGTAAVVRAALPALEQADNGRVVTVASSLGLRVAGDATAYCASKFGVVGFSRAGAGAERARRRHDARPVGDENALLRRPRPAVPARPRRAVDGPGRRRGERRPRAHAPARRRAAGAGDLLLGGAVVAVDGTSREPGAGVGAPPLLILRALGLGDLLTAVPALRALQAAFPDRRRLLAAPPGARSADRPGRLRPDARAGPARAG